MKKLILFLKKLFCFYREPKKEVLIEVENNYSAREGALFRLVNEYRRLNGEKPLVFEATLYKYAKKRCNQMGLEGLLSHEGFKGGVRMAIIEEGFNYAGENIAWQYETVEKCFKALTKSERHNKNMLNKSWKYTAVNIKEIDGRIYYCQIFAR